MGNIPSFSSTAISARSRLYSSHNDITIYVEDTTMQHFYLEIFRRLFGSKIKLTRIFGLGGKGSLLREHTKYCSKGKPRPLCIFIADRDLDPFLDICQIDDEVLFYLEEYCLENYFIEEAAFEAAIQWKLRCCPSEVSQNGVDFSGWYSNTVAGLLELFSAFVLCRKYNLGSNVQQSEYRFINNNCYTVNQAQIQQYVENLKIRYCSDFRCNESDFNKELEDVKEKIVSSCNGEIHKAVSGKYLVASMLRYASNVCKKNIDAELFLGMLVTNFEIEKLSFIRKRVFTLLGISA